MRLSSLLLLALICSLQIVACSKNDTPKVAVVAARENNPAPEVSVASVANDSILKLSSLKGKVVLLNFWATWCPPCREEIPSMMKLNKFMTGKQFQMVAISIDEGGKKAIDSFFKESGFSLPTYLDPTGESARAYGITGVPESFIIDKNGVLVKKVVGGLEWNSPEVVAFLEGLMK